MKSIDCSIIIAIITYQNLSRTEIASISHLTDLLEVGLELLLEPTADGI